MRHIRSTLALALSFGCVAFAAGEAAVDSPAFEIALAVTDRGNAIFEAWDDPTGRAFSLESIKTAKRGKFLSALVLFKGCKPDNAGNCDAEVDFTAYDPSGKVYGKMPNAELWRAKPAPSPGFTQLG